MESRIPYFLPSNEESKEIKAGNKSLIDRFYLQNLPQIRACANAYVSRKHGFAKNTVEDYIQESYLHFSEFSFENIGYFTRTLYLCFHMYDMGGKRKWEQKQSRYSVSEEECILDVAMPSGEGTFGDYIPSNDFVMLEPRFSISDKLYAYLSSFLNTQYQRKLFAYFYWTGFSYNDLGDLLGKEPAKIRNMRSQIFKKFRKRQDEIREFLDEIGYADSKGVPA